MVLRTLFLLIFLTVPVFGELSLAPLFQDGAVLQHGKPVPVWGKAGPGEEITVTFKDQSVAGTASDDGRWSVTLDPLHPNPEPADLVIAGMETTITLTDILVGEVWIASGQSNMEWSISNSYDADLEEAMANWPLIREFNIPRTVAAEPQFAVQGRWLPARPDTIGQFSAIAYSFARDLHQVLQIPVGIVNATWGGSPVETWIDPVSLAHPDFVAVHSRATRQPHHVPSALYNGMIHPVAPYAIQGAIWYQGENNARDRLYKEYQPLFSAMIEGWREVFGQGDFPFYWVQLAEYRASGPDGDEWAFLREAQTRTLALPATGQAVILDISDVHDIHPRNKQTVGRRLARLALSRTYGYDLVDSGPTFERVEFEDRNARIYFSNTHDGLRTTAVAVRGFEVAGEDRHFHPATATISGDSVTVTSDVVSEPQAVRYAWRNAPEATLSNGAGLPAAPFRTDDW